MAETEGALVALAMTSDRSSLPAPLEFGFWYARFRNPDDAAHVDLLIFPEHGLAAAGVLWDGAGLEIDRGATSPVTLRYERAEELSDGAVVEAVRVEPGAVPPGRYRLTVTVRDLLDGRTSTSRSVKLELTP